LIAVKDVLLFNGLAVSARELSAVRKGDRLVFTLPAGRYSIRVD